MASITEAPNNLTLTAKAELCAYLHTSRHDCWAVANIKAPLYEPESRVPIDVVAVIDVSGAGCLCMCRFCRQFLYLIVTLVLPLVSLRAFAVKRCAHFGPRVWKERNSWNFGNLARDNI